MKESKIKELFQNECTVYVFDLDGVLAPIEYGEYNHYYYDDEEWSKAILEKDFYEDVRPIKTFQDFLKEKDKSFVYVVTKVMNEEEKRQKIKFVKKNYQIEEDHVYGVYHDLDKLKAMKEIQKNHPHLEDRYFVMIDDTVNILNDIMEHSSFSTVHVSSFLK